MCAFEGGFVLRLSELGENFNRGLSLETYGGAGNAIQK